MAKLDITKQLQILTEEVTKKDDLDKGTKVKDGSKPKEVKDELEGATKVKDSEEKAIKQVPFDEVEETENLDNGHEPDLKDIFGEAAKRSKGKRFKLKEGAPFRAEQLVSRAVMRGYITPDEALDPSITDAAQQTVEYWEDWPEGQGFGSSDMTQAMKEFLQNCGFKADFNKEGYLERLHEAPRNGYDEWNQYQNENYGLLKEEHWDMDDSDDEFLADEYNTGGAVELLQQLQSSGTLSTQLQTRVDEFLAQLGYEDDEAEAKRLLQKLVNTGTISMQYEEQARSILSEAVLKEYKNVSTYVVTEPFTIQSESGGTLTSSEGRKVTPVPFKKGDKIEVSSQSGSLGDYYKFKSLKTGQTAAYMELSYSAPWKRCVKPL